MNANDVPRPADVATPTLAPTPVPIAVPNRKRPARVGLILGATTLALTAIAAAIYAASTFRDQQTTEDAFVNGNVVNVTAQVGGVVTALAADNTDYVTAGSPLVKLDDVDAQLALARATAQLAKTVRQARAQVAAAGQAGAPLQLRQIDLARAKADQARRQTLQASGAIAGEEVAHAEETVLTAQAALDAAKQQLAGSQALVDRTSIESNPDVMAAAAQVRDAVVATYRTRVPAPVSGVVTRRNVQLGQKINPGVALMSVVPLDHLWVDATFKESQLGDIRIGQAVTLRADLYGHSVAYDGTVVGQDAGTGSAFSLLPAQNATGNWIKVVQRIPIRIALDPKQVAAYPLQLGLSMKVTVDTSQQAGARLAAAGTTAHGDQTEVFANQLTPADDIVRTVIQGNR